MEDNKSYSNCYGNNSGNDSTPLYRKESYDCKIDVESNKPNICPTKGLLVVVNVIGVILLVWIVVWASFLQSEVSQLKADGLIHKKHLFSPQTLNRVKKEKGFCLDCSELKHVYLNGGSTEITKYFTIDHEEKTCCIKKFQDFWTFVKTIADRKVNTEIIKGNLCRPSKGTVYANCTKQTGDNPAAHLVRGGPAYLLQNDYEGQELREWFDSRDKGFRTGIGYQDGRLVVLETGNYYVYSQVFFVQTFARTSDLASLYGLESSDPFAGGSNRVWHAVYRFNEDYPNNHEDSLLRSAQTKCWSKKKDYELRTSYLGAVFSLRAGDQLMVRVSNVSLVSSETQSTYFGMYKI